MNEYELKVKPIFRKGSVLLLHVSELVTVFQRLYSLTVLYIHIVLHTGASLSTSHRREVADSVSDHRSTTAGAGVSVLLYPGQEIH